MIAVSDTSPLNYLIQIEAIAVLEALFERVLIPSAVFQELGHPCTPCTVRQWMTKLPRWLEVQEVQRGSRDEFTQLDPGEREVLWLAEITNPDVILLDESAGRRIARLRRMPIVGTLGVLERAAEHELLDFPEALRRLQQTNFRVSRALLHELLEKDARRTKRTKWF